MIQFFHPSILFGFIACSIPIILHLIFRRRFQRLPWAAMKFLLDAYKKTKSSILLENLLLLIIRVLIIILLTLVFARPVASKSSILPMAKSTQHHVFVIDNSFSMGIQEDNISPFQKAKKFIREKMDKMSGSDTITILEMNESPQTILAFTPVASEARNKIIESLLDMKLSSFGTNIEVSLELLRQELKNQKHKNKHIYILSDLQRHAWQKAINNIAFRKSLEEVEKNTSSIHLVDMGTTQTNNLAVVGISTDSVVGVGTLSKFKVQLKNYTQKPYQDVQVTFYVNGSNHGTENVAVGSGELLDVPFYHTFDVPGNHTIEAQITADTLKPDNHHYLSLEVVERIKVLVIDGEPKEGRFKSETDFFMTATKTSDLIQAEKVDVGSLANDIRFRDYDVIVLGNLRTFADPERFQELKNFANSGKSVMIWLGEEVSSQHYNDILYEDGLGIFPGRLKSSPIGKPSKEAEQTFLLSDIDYEHRAWQYFRNDQGFQEVLEKMPVYRFSPIEVDQDDIQQEKGDRVEILAKYDPTGYPAVLEKRFGKGRILVFTTSMDREWNSFNSGQFAPAFIVMAQEMLQYLVAKAPEEKNLVVGQMITRSFDSYIKEAQIVRPDKSNTPIGIQRKKSLTETYNIEYRETSQAGLYTLETSGPPTSSTDQQDSVKQEFFAINVDTEESNLEKVSKEEIIEKLQPIRINFSQEAKQDGNSEISEEVEYWQHLLFLLFLLALLETLLGMKFGSYSK